MTASRGGTTNMSSFIVQQKRIQGKRQHFLISIPPQHYGKFYPQDAYVLLHTRRSQQNQRQQVPHPAIDKTNKIIESSITVMYIWIGHQCQTLSVQEAHEFTVLKVNGDDNTFVDVNSMDVYAIVPQGLEPWHFYSMFPTSNSSTALIIHDAGTLLPILISNKNERIESPQSSLFHVQMIESHARTNSKRIFAYAICVPPTASSLNSQDVFLSFVNQGGNKKCYLWYGQNSAEHDQRVGVIFATKLMSDSIDHSSSTLETTCEGQETLKFWEMLGGKVPYLNCRPSTLKDLKINNHPPILYTLTPEQNYQWRKIGTNLAEVNLSEVNPRSIMILDDSVVGGVFFWIGSLIHEQEVLPRRCVKDIMTTLNKLRSKRLLVNNFYCTVGGLSCIIVRSGKEPEMFKRYFRKDSASSPPVGSKVIPQKVTTPDREKLYIHQFDSNLLEKMEKTAKEEEKENIGVNQKRTETNQNETTSVALPIQAFSSKYEKYPTKEDGMANEMEENCSTVGLDDGQTLEIDAQSHTFMEHKIGNLVHDTEVSTIGSDDASTLVLETRKEEDSQSYSTREDGVVNATDNTVSTAESYDLPMLALERQNGGEPQSTAWNEAAFYDTFPHVLVPDEGIKYEDQQDTIHEAPTNGRSNGKTKKKVRWSVASVQECLQDCSCCFNNKKLRESSHYNLNSSPNSIEEAVSNAPTHTLKQRNEEQEKTINQSPTFETMSKIFSCYSDCSGNVFDEKMLGKGYCNFLCPPTDDVQPTEARAREPLLTTSSVFDTPGFEGSRVGIRIDLPNSNIMESVTVAELIEPEFILWSKSVFVSPPELVRSSNTVSSFDTTNPRNDKPSAVGKFLAAAEKAANRALDEVERRLDEAELMLPDTQYCSSPNNECYYRECNHNEPSIHQKGDRCGSSTAKEHYVAPDNMNEEKTIVVIFEFDRHAIEEQIGVKEALLCAARAEAEKGRCKLVETSTKHNALSYDNAYEDRTTMVMLKFELQRAKDQVKVKEALLHAARAEAEKGRCKLFETKASVLRVKPTLIYDVACCRNTPSNEGKPKESIQYEDLPVSQSVSKKASEDAYSRNITLKQGSTIDCDIPISPSTPREKSDMTDICKNEENNDSTPSGQHNNANKHQEVSSSLFPLSSIGDSSVNYLAGISSPSLDSECSSMNVILASAAGNLEGKKPETVIFHHVGIAERPSNDCNEIINPFQSILTEHGQVSAPLLPLNDNTSSTTETEPRNIIVSNDEKSGQSACPTEAPIVESFQTSPSLSRYGVDSNIFQMRLKNESHTGHQKTCKEDEICVPPKLVRCTNNTSSMKHSPPEEENFSSIKHTTHVDIRSEAIPPSLSVAPDPVLTQEYATSADGKLKNNPGFSLPVDYSPIKFTKLDNKQKPQNSDLTTRLTPFKANILINANEISDMSFVAKGSTVQFNEHTNEHTEAIHVSTTLLHQSHASKLTKHNNELYPVSKSTSSVQKLAHLLDSQKNECYGLLAKSSANRTGRTSSVARKPNPSSKINTVDCGVKNTVGTHSPTEIVQSFDEGQDAKLNPEPTLPSPPVAKSASFVKNFAKLFEKKKTEFPGLIFESPSKGLTDYSSTKKKWTLSSSTSDNIGQGCEKVGDTRSPDSWMIETNDEPSVPSPPVAKSIRSVKSFAKLFERQTNECGNDFADSSLVGGKSSEYIVTSPMSSARCGAKESIVKRDFSASAESPTTVLHSSDENEDISSQRDPRSFSHSKTGGSDRAVITRANLRGFSRMVVSSMQEKSVPVNSSVSAAGFLTVTDSGNSTATSKIFEDGGTLRSAGQSTCKTDLMKSNSDQKLNVSKLGGSVKAFASIFDKPTASTVPVKRKFGKQFSVNALAPLTVDQTSSPALESPTGVAALANAKSSVMEPAMKAGLNCNNSEVAVVADSTVSVPNGDLTGKVTSDSASISDDSTVIVKSEKCAPHLLMTSADGDEQESVMQPPCRSTPSKTPIEPKLPSSSPSLTESAATFTDTSALSTKVIFDNEKCCQADPQASLPVDENSAVQAFDFPRSGDIRAGKFSESSSVMLDESITNDDVAKLDSSVSTSCDSSTIKSTTTACKDAEDIQQKICSLDKTSQVGKTLSTEINCNTSSTNTDSSGMVASLAQKLDSSSYMVKSLAQKLDKKPKASKKQNMNYYSIEELKSGNAAGVDNLRKESYLSPDEFEDVFGMSKEEFVSLPKWKQSNEKKRVGLF